MRKDWKVFPMLLAARAAMVAAIALSSIVALWAIPPFPIFPVLPLNRYPIEAEPALSGDAVALVSKAPNEIDNLVTIKDTAYWLDHFFRENEIVMSGVRGIDGGSILGFLSRFTVTFAARSEILWHGSRWPNLAQKSRTPSGINSRLPANVLIADIEFHVSANDVLRSDVNAHRRNPRPLAGLKGCPSDIVSVLGGDNSITSQNGLPNHDEASRRTNGDETTSPKRHPVEWWLFLGLASFASLAFS